MSEEIKILLGFGALVSFVVFAFTRICKPDNDSQEKPLQKADSHYQMPRPAESPWKMQFPLTWALPVGTKVYVEGGRNVAKEGVIVAVNNAKYVVEIEGSGKKFYSVATPDKVWTRKGDNEND